jgi:hypothetical protein
VKVVEFEFVAAKLGWFVVVVGVELASRISEAKL